MILQTLKYWVKKLPITFTQNQRYDKQTKEIIKRVVGTDTVCIDIGCHKGEILDSILKQAPTKAHYAFEPIPSMFTNLKQKYKHTKVNFFEIALSNEVGNKSFNHVISNPSYSGLEKRKYDREGEKEETITVCVDTLDNIIPTEEKIDFIKIDVEGGEWQVLLGAKRVLQKSKPIILFEHGLGASEFYGANPILLFDYLDGLGMQISTMQRWLQKKPAFSKEDFSNQFYQRVNYYFIAYPIGGC